MKTAVTIAINNLSKTADVEARTSLADFVRDACGLTGTHLACEHGVCGACTILLDGEPVRSCLVLAVQANRRVVTTVEGFSEDPVMERMRQAFSEHHALQCGFCTSGMLVTARDIVVRLGDVDEGRIRQELSGNLCRCTGYEGIVRAIKHVASEKIVAATRPALVSARRQDVRQDVAIPPKPKTLGALGIPAKSSADAMTVEQSFETPYDSEKVWKFFSDPRTVALCLPGAELLSVDGPDLQGRVQIKMGPIKAQFAGEARYLRDDANKRGVLEGRGVDSLSNSRVQGSLKFELTDQADRGTRVDLVLSFTLQGLLAQFSRPALVKDFVGFIVGQFVSNLNTALEGGQAASKSLTFWTLAAWWVRRLMKTAGLG